jgi:ComEC/Rec2-related protein
MTGAWLEIAREWLARQVDRRPLLAAAIVVGAAVWAADGAWLAGGGLVAALAAALLWTGKSRMTIGFLALAVGVGGFHWSDVGGREMLRQRVGDGRPAEVVVRVAEVPRQAGGKWFAVVDDIDTRARYRLEARGVAPRRGSVVAARGVLKPIERPRNPGEFDRVRWLDRLGVALVLEAGPVPELREPAPRLATVGDGIRETFRDAVTAGLDPHSEEAVVIRAVVLGERPDDAELLEPFRLTGTLHVFAVSGLHVGMVGVLGWMALRFAGVPRRHAILPLMAMMLGYAWLTGLKPPALRASWMAAVILGAFLFRRRPNVANALGLAALGMLALDGDLLFKAGPQLSFGVVAVISLLYPVVSRLYAPIAREEPYLPRALYGPWREGWLHVRRRAAELLSVSTAAWLGSAPLTAFHFGIFTPLAVLASAALSLLVFPLLGLALLSAAISPLPHLGEWLNRANAKLAGLVLATARAGAAVPGGHAFVARDRPADDFVLVYDLGGDGAAVWHLDGHTGLIDGGGNWSFGYTLAPSLETMALVPRAVVATHPDGGHVGGLIQAWDRYPIDRALAPVLRALGPNYRDWVERGESVGTHPVRGRRGRRYPIADGVFLDVPHEPDPWNWHQRADDRVMPVRLHWHGWKILFMGDAGWATERAMLESGADFSADVIVAGRHGHDATLGDRFVEASGARAIVATHERFPAAQRIPESWRRHCEARGIAVFHQGESGAVAIFRDAGHLRLRGHLDGRTARLAPSSGNAR